MKILTPLDLTTLITPKISNFNVLVETFLKLRNELEAHLNLNVINKNIKIHIIKERNCFREKDPELFNKGVSRFTNNHVYHIKLFDRYKKFFPFFLLESAYLTFVPNNLKQVNVIKFAINQFVEHNLQELSILDEWKLFTRDRFIYDNFRFEKFLELGEKKSLLKPIRFFFESIRRYKELDLDQNKKSFLNKIYKEFVVKSKIDLKSNDIVETLRVLTQIFFKVEICDSLSSFFIFFNKFKKNGLVETNLSLRNFKKNLRWINKFSKVAPTYYFNWKAFNIAIIPCYFKFNPLLEKNKIDRIVSKIPFLVMPKLSINNFSIELSAYFVIPKIYIKDLKRLIKNMEEYGYLIEKYCALANAYEYFLNLNYFREFHKNGLLLNPKNNKYSKKYEMVFRQDYDNFKQPHLNLLEFLILERTRFFSNVGISFSRSREISKVIQSDLTSSITKKKRFIKRLEEVLLVLTQNPDLKKKFLNFIENNQILGFFYNLHKLEKWLVLFDLINRTPQGTFKNITEIKKFFKRENVLNLIEEEGFYEKLNFSSFSFKSIFSKFLNSRERYNIEAERIKYFYQFLKISYNLKILNLKDIKKIFSNLKLLKQIIEKKKADLSRLKYNNSTQRISNKSINKIIEKFSKKDLKLIKPYLIDTIWKEAIAGYFPQIIVKKNPGVRKNIEKIKNFFPKIYFYESIDILNKHEVIFLQLYVPYLKDREKIIFLSILSNIFKDNIIILKRYPWNGLLKTFSRRDFFDFKNTEFFYNKDLFREYFTFIKRVLGRKLKSRKKISNNFSSLFQGQKNFKSLIRVIRNRLSHEKFEFSHENLNYLLDFHKNLKAYCFNSKKLKKELKKNSIRKYVKLIKIFPAFQYFGLEQYFLYITPFDFLDIDFELLFMNTFQKIKYLASIELTASILIRYIFPYNDPNISYLNWLRSMNKLSEYCLFSIKKFNQIFHFNYNLTSNGWNLDINGFKIYIQNILSDPNHKVKDLDMKVFKVGNLSVSNYQGLESSYFKDLMDLYDRETIDIKRNLNLSNYSVLEKIQNLTKKKMIFPYITFRNLDLREKIYFMLFNIPRNSIETIKKVFQYFNLVHLYEIEGEYYIYGLDQPQKIQNGLMIKLFLPECELAEILKTLEYVFQYLEVEKYLIIPDLVDGESFLKTVYGDISFLEDYNPLNNLIWDERTKTWKNHTLFTQNFEYLYPELVNKKNNSQ